ncbi:MAG: insulinase family protein [Gammaproteobacteria bacterium]|jgi:Zn-dependent M16 (insulinase) family peptidase|nr:insulinase family protein [Gammaproteobacteria bacterium]MBK6581767.1 insulinase family protein [Gammaproteobacteria bacterium]MBK7728485.1 insulinase family protein [Gammaproteobacteria bacterium]MBP6052216.1 insulinase family protein [Pseudomonadales bacterium]MBP6227655.1 insulinase family protein [Pseudomonadales bacterium]
MNSPDQQAPATRASETTHNAFEWVRSEPISALNAVIEEYRHRVTGAQHFHIATDNTENVFLVALRTVPQDSTGVAHILEHTALCGSEKYPVRDPFFMMTRRSLNTFMNAFTSSDWTAYPFASQNRKDFFNLLDVYLDAVFFANLDPLDFAQEGHRLEFSTPSDTSSPLEFKGVVYNEMKGAMSSISSTLWQTLSKYLFPYTTYHYNSGGDPEHIPDLSYQGLRDFYRSHYHPSNAVFMSYGDIPVAELHQRFEDRALQRFEALDVHIEVPDEKRYVAPLAVEESYAWEEEGDASEKSHVVLGWLLGKSTSLEELLQAHLLNGILLDNSSSPLQKALETSELGSAPSPLCGLEDSHREIVFSCGLEGCASSAAQDVESLVLDTLQDIAENGVPIEQVRSVLHQLELHQREIGGDGYPFGLQLILMAISGAVHRGDPVAVLNLEPVLEKLHRDIEDPAYVKRLVRELLLDNPHRVRLLLKPDTELAARRRHAEEQRLAKIRAGLDEQQAAEIVATASTLLERQNGRPDDSCLPRVTIADVPADVPEIESRPIAASTPITAYARGTNGIVYQQVIVELPALGNELLELLPYYTDFLTELGSGGRDYLQTQALQAALSGGLNAHSTVRGALDDEQRTRGVLVLSSKALARNATELFALLRETLEHARFDELQRIGELLSQMRARRDQSITGSGHALAMSAASSRMSPTALLAHSLSGLEGIRRTRRIEKSFQDEANIAAFAARLAALHEAILGAPRQLLLVSDAEHTEANADELQRCWQNPAAPAADTPLALAPVRDTVREIWQTSTQVNFCAKSYPTVPIAHADAAALTVLGGFLRNGFLHRAIREQGGAYGGGASQDSGIAAFRFYSYRDPRTRATLDDFDAALDWLQNTPHQWQQVEEAILGVISSLDKPGSPAGEAKKHFHENLFGRTRAQHREFRARVLAVTVDDLQRVGASYLDPARASLAVITNAPGAAALKKDPLLADAELKTL